MADDPQQTPQNGDYRVIRLVSFGVVTLLFILAAVRQIFQGKEIDNIISVIFIAIIGSAWGANLFKTFL